MDCISNKRKRENTTKCVNKRAKLEASVFPVKQINDFNEKMLENGLRSALDDIFRIFEAIICDFKDGKNVNIKTNHYDGYVYLHVKIGHYSTGMLYVKVFNRKIYYSPAQIKSNKTIGDLDSYKAELKNCGSYSNLKKKMQILNRKFGKKEPKSTDLKVKWDNHSKYLKKLGKNYSLRNLVKENNKVEREEVEKYFKVGDKVKVNWHSSSYENHSKSYIFGVVENITATGQLRIATIECKEEEIDYVRDENGSTWKTVYSEFNWSKKDKQKSFYHYKDYRISLFNEEQLVVPCYYSPM